MLKSNDDYIRQRTELAGLNLTDNDLAVIRKKWEATPTCTVDDLLYGLRNLGQAVQVARERWHVKHGKCSMCSVGDKPVNGKHRGQFRCGNDDACMLCRGCLPEGEQCQACGRINMEVTPYGG